jgi:hypothetical protein
MPFSTFRCRFNETRSSGDLPDRAARQPASRQLTDGEIPMLDVLYVLGIIALAAVVALIGKGVEKL